MGLGLILVIVIRKFPMISSIDTKAVPRHAQKEMKKDLIEQRLTRKFDAFFKLIVRYLKPVGDGLKKFTTKTYNRIVDMEKQYSLKVQQPQKLVDKVKIKSKVDLLLQEAEDLQKAEKFKEAEKKYIEIISLDKENIQAFELLGELYMEMKEFDFAHETFSHMLRIDPDNALVYHDLGLLALRQDNKPLAVKNFEKALEIEPNNPKMLDRMLETCLETKDKVIAWECLNKLKEVNPDNQKIGEFEGRIKELEKDLKIKK